MTTATQTTSKLEQTIAAGIAQLEAERNQKQAQNQDKIVKMAEICGRAIRQELGEYEPMLAPYLTIAAVDMARYRGTIDAAPLRLSRIIIDVRIMDYSTNPIQINSAVNPGPDMPAALVAARLTFEQEAADAERREANDAKVREELEAQRAADADALKAYSSAFADYLRSIKAHRGAIAGAVNKWNAEHAHTYTLIDVEIGIIATDDDGAPFASPETRTTLGKDGAGYWLEVTSYGTVTPRRYMHLVSEGAPRTITPGPFQYGTLSNRLDSGLCLYAAPMDDVNLVAVGRAIEAAAPAMLDEPERPDLYRNRWMTDDLEQSIAKELEIEYRRRSSYDD